MILISITGIFIAIIISGFRIAQEYQRGVYRVPE
jgi:hypothetical protein